ncbi:MAG: hemolysin III family protein [Microbacteriaceae bacterium]
MTPNFEAASSQTPHQATTNGSERSLDETQAIFLPVSTGFPLADNDRPSWRGWIHTGVLPVVIACGVLLIVFADGAAGKVAASIFFASSFLLFGNSALYHRFNWKPRVKLALKRIDHANIVLLIAGSYTPMTMLALPFEKGLPLLIIVWSTALLGMGFRVLWVHAPRWLYVPIYIAMGASALIYVVDFYQANQWMMILIGAGGALYIAGAIVYGLKKPNPFPKHFGFHEIFHAFTVLAFLCHWTAALLICLNPLQGSFAG